MLPRSNAMIVWTPIAVNEKSLLRGKKRLLPEYSAAFIGSSVVLRLFPRGFTGLSLALTTFPFAPPDAAGAWVEANRTDMSYESELPDGSWTEGASRLVACDVLRTARASRAC